VLESLEKSGLPVIAMPPSTSVTATGGQVSSWDLVPIQSALAAGLVPLINGDTIFDTHLGGTILSTEELFFHLARQLKPRRIALAGIETGVWADFPTCTRFIESITPDQFEQVTGRLRGSAAVDVTGGMLTKVQTMIELLEDIPGLEILIFSGLVPGNVNQALAGKVIGTRIST
jgi:isopentenyl phosphate kinase